MTRSTTPDLAGNPERTRFSNRIGFRGRMLLQSCLLLSLLLVLACGGGTSTGEDSQAPEAEAEAEAQQPRGLMVNQEGVSDGYVLFAPLLSGTTYLINNEGEVVHLWETSYAPSGSVYLLESGRLLRTARQPEVPVFKGGGQGGRIEEFNWNGELTWDFEYFSEDYLLHHDIEVLPNGNILAIAWERKTPEEARKAGRNPDAIPEAGIWPDKVIEIEPTRPKGGRIVWEWHLWDHLVQDHDPNQDNYGDPAASLGKVNINGDRRVEEIDPEELEQLKALGYVTEDTTPEDLSSDLFHTNAIDYNAELDQIALSSPRFNEIWIIDHSTTTAEAAGDRGGRWGRGGEILYRWGNPQVYGRGSEIDRKLFEQHDVRWIRDGAPGAGHLTIFNNALPSPDGGYSAVFEIEPPVNPDGSYVQPANGPFGPAEPAWRYEAPDKYSFFSPFISGATRLPGGNTLICEGAKGRFFEVTPEGKIVWDYSTIYSGNIRNPDGSFPHPVGKATYAVFRAARILPDHPALSGRDLKPLSPQPPAVPGPVPPENEE